jgi:hypothetical protein
MKNRHYLKSIFAFAVLLSISYNSTAALTTYLDIDCGSWVERKDTKAVQYEAYLIGFMTGMNSMWTATTQYQQNKSKYKEDIFKGVTNANQIFLSMDKFCKENPFKNVLEGSYTTFIQLRQKE